MTTFHKCPCGDPVCRQYVLSSQGSVGFSLEDARLYAAASDLLTALRELVAAQSIEAGEVDRRLALLDALNAIAKAEGKKHG